MALFNRVHDAGRVITSMGNKVNFLRKEVQRLREGGDPEVVAAVEGRAFETQTLAENLQAELDETTHRRESIEKETQVQEMETKLLKLTQARDALRTDLPRQAIEDYKKSAGFEMGLVRMGRVSLEYGYQLALAQLRARHPGVEIEEDRFALLPDDASMPMADEQPFDDSPPSPEE
ncbi:hypothetical protein BHM03_00048407 [Ensete ventricosum]|nr:hypothetical protein BHM03_00048407 [Ensete ventricosum]